MKWTPVGLVLLAAVVAGCSGTTYGTGVSPGRQTVEDLTGLVTLGKNKDKEPVDYAPRAAIVTPPQTASLPKPGTGAPAGNWPTDPDAVTKTGKKNSLALAEDRASGQSDAQILADPGFRLPSNTKETRVYNDNDPDSAENQMRQMRTVKDQEAIFAKAKASRTGSVDAAGNPVRTSLTEPPATYRVPDPESQDEFNTAKDEKWWQFGKKKSTTSFESKDEDLVFTNENDIRPE